MLSNDLKTSNDGARPFEDAPRRRLALGAILSRFGGPGQASEIACKGGLGPMVFFRSLLD
jgi:hypothetical protein